MTRGLVQTGGLARRSDPAPRKALRRSSDTAPRCLESASTTDVSRHEHPRQTSPLETVRRAAVGNPPTFDLETDHEETAFPPFRPRTAPDHLAVIRPPTTPCLTARRRLRADRLPAFALARSVREMRAPQLCRLQGGSADSNPLTPLERPVTRTGERPRYPVA
jgi:hypothetical protein